MARNWLDSFFLNDRMRTLKAIVPVFFCLFFSFSFLRKDNNEVDEEK